MANPTETVLTAAQVTAKSGTTDTNTGLPSATIGETNYQTTTYDWNEKVERNLAVSTGLRVVKSGTGTNCGVWSGEYVHNGAAVAYAGAATQALVNDDNNWVYLTAAGVLTVNQTGFPAAAHVPLATVAVGTSSAAAVTSKYDHVDIVDYRQRALFRTVGQIELRSHQIPMQSLRNADFTVMTSTPAAGNFAYSAGGFGSGILATDGEAASGNTKTGTLSFQFQLPANYVASGDVRMTAKAIEQVGAATVSTTISGEVYESTGEAGVSADILASWDQTDITTSYQAFVATITDAALVPGDVLTVFIRIVTDDSGGAVGSTAEIGSISIDCDVYTDF